MSIKDSLFSQVMRTKDFQEVRVDDNAHRYNESWLYYLGQRPVNIEEPTEEQIARGEDAPMEYVEPVVRNAVTAITPQILDIFTENDEQAVCFRDHSFKPNPIMAEIINAQINRTVLSENDGYRLLENALKETLVSGDCFSKIYIDESHDDSKIELNDWSDLETVIAELSEKNWQCDLPEEIGNGVKSGTDGNLSWRTVKQPTDDGMGNQGEPTVNIELKGTLEIYRVDKKLVIENVGLRDLLIDTTCGEDFEKCRYICHKMTMTVGEAVDLGYKAKSLESASTVARLADAPYNKFNLVTNNQIGMTEEDWDDNGDPLERLITIYEHYIYSSIPNKGRKSALYQVHTTDSELLDYREISTMPFVHGQVDTIPESFWGRSMYDIFAPYQDNESKMQRLAYKNAFNATYNKVLVTKNQYNAESVINSNTPGAIIEQNVAGAIQPWPYVELPQSFVIASQKLAESRAQTMGQMIGGINAQETQIDQMSGYSIAQILAQEQLKGKVIAKTFARTYIKPLYTKIYEVLKGNGMKIVIPAGTKFQSMSDPLPQDMTITSDQFPERYDFTIDIETQGDTAMQNRQLATVLQMATTVQPNSVADASSIYKVADTLLKQMGLNAADYFKDPAQQQMSDEQAEQIAFQKETAQLQMQKLIAEITKTTSEAGLNEVKLGNDAQESQVKIQTMLSESLANIQKHKREADNADRKTALDAVAVNAEIHNQSKDIAIKNANTLINAHKTVNGIRV